MESKPSKAALARIEELKGDFEKGKYEGEDAYGIPRLLSLLKEINKIIEEYKLEDKIDVIENRVYL